MIYLRGVNMNSQANTFLPAIPALLLTIILGSGFLYYVVKGLK